MSDSPIFDQLQAEFVEESKYIRLVIGPLVGEGFERVEVIDEYFGTIGYVHRMISIADEVSEMVDEMAIIADEAEAVVEKPRLYIIEGAPELINLDKVASEETEMEKTISIPVFKSDATTPPSMKMLDETQVIPVVEEVAETTVEEPEKETEEKIHVFPIKRVKAIHKKISATGTLGWFINSANRAA